MMTGPYPLTQHILRIFSLDILVAMAIQICQVPLAEIFRSADAYMV